MKWHLKTSRQPFIQRNKRGGLHTNLTSYTSLSAIQSESRHHRHFFDESSLAEQSCCCRFCFRHSTALSARIYSDNSEFIFAQQICVFIAVSLPIVNQFQRNFIFHSESNTSFTYGA